MYSKSHHGRDWLGADINSGLSAKQSAVVGLASFVAKPERSLAGET